MTNHVVRLYAVAGTLVAFFLAWAGIAARPWVAPARDARVVALDQRAQRLQRDAALVRQVLARRRATAQATANAEAAPPPAVRIVTLPPLATTRTS